MRGPVLAGVGQFIKRANVRTHGRVVLVCVIGVVFGFIDLVVDWILKQTDLPISSTIVDGIILGCVAAFAAWFLLQAERERMKRVTRDVEQSAQLNHEIRNALEVITSAGYLLNDVVYGPAVSDSIDRINRSLKSLSPDESRVAPRQGKPN